jgi:hypothetical protein
VKLPYLGLAVAILILGTLATLTALRLHKWERTRHWWSSERVSVIACRPAAICSHCAHRQKCECEAAIAGVTPASRDPVAERPMLLVQDRGALIFVKSQDVLCR